MNSRQENAQAPNSDAMGHQRIATVLGLAVLLTTGAEIFYLVVWGLVLFPEGSVAGKTVWTLTCGVAMGSAIGAGTLIFAETMPSKRGAFWCAALIVTAVGSYCAWLCSAIDARFSYFGGPEETALFIAAGIVPALIGSLLYGWALYGWTRPNTTA